MFPFLKNHPFAVEAFFENSIVLTFAFPKAALQPLIPKCLELDLFNDKWAFIAVAIVKTKALRPKGFPEFMGNDFMLVGYRIFVRYTNNAGKRLRGLYILKSETDKISMKVMGGIFTHYNYSLTDIKQTCIADEISVDSISSNLHIKLKKHDEIELPLTSPFADWKEARRFAGPLPFTFTFIEEKNEVLIIEGVRENWTPEPIKVIDYSIPFLQSAEFSGGLLASAFIINNIPYYWKKGKVERWIH